jgi:cytochrome b561
MGADGTDNRRIFDLTTRLMHWSTAGLMLLVFAAAFSIDLATTAAAHKAILNFHRMLGLSVWLLTFARLTWRNFAQYPAWSKGMTPTMRVLAKSCEYCLYGLLLLQPLLGLLQTNAHGERVSLLFIGQLPALISKDRPLALQLLTVHKAVGFSLLGLIAGHACAALWHHFVRRDDTLTAMLPVSEAWRIPRAGLTDCDAPPGSTLGCGMRSPRSLPGSPTSSAFKG